MRKWRRRMPFSMHAVSVADDLVALCAIMQPEHWAVDNQMTSYQPAFLQKFLESGGILLLAKVGEQVVGAAIAYRMPHPDGEHALYVHELDTHPDFRRQGIATDMMRALQALAHKEHFAEVWVGAEASDKAANAVYRSLHPDDEEAATLYFYRAT